MPAENGKGLVLAGCASRYSEMPPPLLLRPHFRCAWTCEVDRSCTGQIVVVPDGSADLMWRDGRLSVAGPDVTAARPVLRPGSVILGLRFAPGAAARWLGIAMEEIVGREVALNELWGREAIEAAESIGEATTWGGRAFRLQSFLARKSMDIGPPPPDAAAIFGWFDATGAIDRKIDRLRARLSISERTLRRKSQHLFGYGPKTLDRILRFRRFHMLASEDSAGSLAGLALSAGYADQAHLSREVHAMSGLTPGAFVRQLRAA